MRHLVLGTSGHIDHGKSALVRALTGTDPDRLKEEKLRGITIDLGFAHAEVAPGRIVSFVDVPGHERFVRHMVAGAAGVDAVLLVVAADEGVKPQTVEHVAICSLLGLRDGLVAVTKTDLVDHDMVEVVILELRDFLAGGFLAQAPIVPVSARTGAGLDALRAEIARLFDRIPERSASGVPRLPVDRSFVLKGFGTVVTGTLAAGRLAVGSEIEVLPGHRRGRIRGLQVHGQWVREAVAGWRTAANLQGLDREEVPRGCTVSIPGALLVTDRLWARVTLLPSAPAALRRGGLVRFHQGTSEGDARLRVLKEEPGGALGVEIRLGEPCVVLPGDRFILRRPAPVDTVGGGVVLDARPPRRWGGGAAAPAFERGVAGDLATRVARAGLRGASAAALAAERGLAPEEIEREVELARAAGSVVAAGGLLFDAAAWRDLSEKVVAAVGEFHRADPLRLGVGREELRSRCCREVPHEAWRVLLEGLASAGRLSLEGDRVAAAHHSVVLSGRDRELADRVDGLFRRAGLDPPDPDAAFPSEEPQRLERIVQLLVAGGRLVRIRDGRLFHAEALEALKSRLREYAKTSRTIDVAAFKELAGVTRRNAIPLLEHLDQERATRRVGNVREILDV